MNSSVSPWLGSALSRLGAALRNEPLAFPALFLLALWLQFFLSLTPFWTIGAYYDYGWFVPLAGGWFFWRRWQALQPRLPSSGPAWPRWADFSGIALLLAVAVLLFCIRVVGRYDPFWRYPLLLHVAVICLVHHGLLARFLGWKHSAYFAPVTLFCLTAVPLPSELEGSVIHWATHQLMTVSAPLCHLFGLPVKLSGSALTLDGTALEIDAGCSGIRSLQSLFMVSLFAGEFFLLRWGSRLALVFLGFVFAMAFNSVRVLILTNIFFRSGEDVFHAWHDMVGLATFALSAMALLGAGQGIKALQATGKGTAGTSATTHAPQS